MYGRGVAVSKSDFATYAFALLALKAAVAEGAKLGGAIELHFTYDEEAGGAIGPAWLLEQGTEQARLRVIRRASPTASPPRTTAACISKSRCSANPVTPPSRTKGVDALEAATGILADLYALRKTYAAIRSKRRGITSPTLVVGLIEGGVNTNVVPDRVVFRLDRRIIPEENPAEVEAALTRASAIVGGEVAGRKRATSGASCWRCRSCRFPDRKRWSPPCSKNARDRARRGHRGARRADVHRRAPLQRRRRADRRSMAPVRARWPKPTAIAPTRISSSTTCTRRPKWWRCRSTTCWPPRSPRRRPALNDLSRCFVGLRGLALHEHRRCDRLRRPSAMCTMSSGTNASPSAQCSSDTGVRLSSVDQVVEGIPGDHQYRAERDHDRAAGAIAADRPPAAHVIRAHRAQRQQDRECRRAVHLERHRLAREALRDRHCADANSPLAKCTHSHQTPLQHQSRRSSHRARAARMTAEPHALGEQVVGAFVGA